MKQTPELRYEALIAQHAEALQAQTPAVLQAPRAAATEAFVAKGFPTKRDERYKYTAVGEAFAHADYQPQVGHVPAIDPYTAYRCPVEALASTSYYIVGDRFCPAPVAMATALPQGVLVMSLAEAARTHADLVAQYYAKQADATQDGITALNTALVQDGVFVYVPQGVKVEQPIQIVSIAQGHGVMSNRRVLIALEAEAEATFVFCEHATAGEDHLCTQVGEVYAGEDSKLQLLFLEETTATYRQFSNFYVHQGARSEAVINSLMLHSGLTRNYLYLALAGEKARVECYGCVVGNDYQHCDNHAVIDHQVPDCDSNILYKYLLDDHAVGAFVGHVLVRPNAQHTYSEETNANICVSPTARLYTRPMLEIYADDVRCNHGATTGQLDTNALFYMQQRGIPEEEARILLQYAFINEVIERIDIPALRDRLSGIIDRRFRGDRTAACGEGQCALCDKKG